MTMTYRFTEDQFERDRARHGGVSADRLEQRADGKRPRARGLKWQGDRLIRDEDAEQAALIAMLAVPMVTSECPELRYLYHTPNGAARPGKTAGVLRTTGVVCGVPDLRWDEHRPYPRYTGHCVELDVAAIASLYGPREPVHIGPALWRLEQEPGLARGLVIEMKAGKTAPSAEQADFLVWLTSRGVDCYVCWTALDAFHVVMAYAGLPFWVDTSDHVHRSKP